MILEGLLVIPLKMMDFTPKVMHFILKMSDFLTKSAS